MPFVFIDQRIDPFESSNYLRDGFDFDYSMRIFEAEPPIGRRIVEDDFAIHCGPIIAVSIVRTAGGNTLLREQRVDENFG